MRQVTDPVCGMVIDADTAPAREEYAGETRYFCSEACAARFRRHPEQFVAAGGARPRNEHGEKLPPHTTEGPITSPMFGAAGSGGAEYEPVPEGKRKK
jgi:YHS domain-containing protein